VKRAEGGKIVKLLVLGCIVFASLAAAPYAAIRAGHDCTGDDFCPVCIQLQGVLNLLRHLGAAAARIALAVGFFGSAAASAGLMSARAVPPSSVSLKVRMNT
jgi:hypothetical protein